VNLSGPGSVDLLVRALCGEFPELERERVRVAVERAIAKAQAARLDTEGYQVVNLHLARVEATEEATERAKILRELSGTLESRGDADRALVTRLAAFGEVPSPDDIEPLLRLARITDRWDELPLDPLTALVDAQQDGAAHKLTELATGWQKVDRPYQAADCLERVLVIEPKNDAAFEALEVFYRSTQEWPVLIDLIGRRAVQVDGDKERAELFREMAVIYERELHDDAGALDAYQEADRLERNHPEAVAGVARLAVRVSGIPEDEALAALERSATVLGDPKERARQLTRAAELAKLTSWDKAQGLYERALKDDPAYVSAIDGYIGLLRDRGQLADTVTVLVNSAERVPSERARWLTDAGDYCVALGDTDWAMQLYRDARAADPSNLRAGAALVELCADSGDLAEIAPLLDELCRKTEDPVRLRGYLLQRSKVAAQLGDQTGARIALSRAVELNPDDFMPRRELADMLFAAHQWLKARPLYEGMLIDEDLLPAGTAPELHFRVARCAKELGDLEAAKKHVGITLALDREHREALMLHAELATDDPAAQLAAANLAPPEERATRFAAIGDRYSEMGDRGAAREMYREAITYRPGDHLLLTKFLELVAEDGDWSYSLDVVQKLVDTEQDPRVRARYRHLAAQIARDELDDPERAKELMTHALEEDPFAFAIADELEQLLRKDDLAAFYARRLEHLRGQEDVGRAGEHLRLWDKLAALSLEVGRIDDAIAALEVARTLAPHDLDRLLRLADLTYATGSHDKEAIAAHQAVLRDKRTRSESYVALRTLYERGGHTDKARAIDEALAVLDREKLKGGLEAIVEGRPAPKTLPSHPLTNDEWLALARIDVDLQLSALFSVVAPPFAVERARMRPPLAAPNKESVVPDHLAPVLGRVLAAFGIPRPPVYIDKDQPGAWKVVLRTRAGTLAPVLLIGRAALETKRSEHDLAFSLARELADLRTDRMARLLCPRAGELAQIIELATGGGTTAARWLTQALHAVEQDQVKMLGDRIRERALHPMSAAAGWLAATERAADRIGLVVAGDLPTCARMVEREAPDRVDDLVWASVTEEMLAIRGRLEGWS
jgi:tetratricopeptide (TPR) repeat protein